MDSTLEMVSAQFIFFGGLAYLYPQFSVAICSGVKIVSVWLLYRMLSVLLHKTFFLVPYLLDCLCILCNTGLARIFPLIELGPMYQMSKAV